MLLFGAAVAAAAVLGISACGSSDGGSDDVASYRAAAAPAPKTGAPPWPAPPDPLRRTRAAGLRPERREQLAYHVHAHLDVLVNGKAVRVPAGIGINISDPAVKHGPGPSYGGIRLCARPCISPLHTHDSTGVLHTESPTPTPNNLGEFFTEWGVRLDNSCVGGFCGPQASIAIFVNGKRYKGDPRSIELADHSEIAIVIGSPPAEIPSFSPLV